MDDNVIICRCQEITYGEIVKAIEDGAISVTGVKKRVGSGMGSCQGKYCEHLVAQIISEKTGIPVSESVLLYTSPSPRDATLSRMPSSA